MRKLSVLLIVVSIAAFVGCSSISVKQDYDPEADFSKYKTYEWLDLPPDYQMSTAEMQVRNSFVDKRIKASTEAEMATKGMEKVDMNPDIYLVYHIGVQDKVDVTNWGYSYHPYSYYGGWAGQDIQVYNYQEGTLVLDFIDADAKALVWRGTAQKVLGDPKSPEQAQKNIDQVMEKLLKQYPPKSK